MEITKKNIEDLPFSNLHIFPYSKRENTVAATMEGQVASNIKKARATELKAIAERKYQEFLEQNIGKNLSVLVEKTSKNTLLGLSENYIEIEVQLKENQAVKKNSIIKVNAICVNKNKIIAELV